MKLTEKQSELFEFVKKMHKGQVRKYTNEPYHAHPLEVAKIVSEYQDDCVEIALCHDLFEDTKCDFTMLYNKLVKIGYERRLSYKICNNVKELTDVFTVEDYPSFNRKWRKEKESIRLGDISYKSQSVKYADLINNTISIVENDKAFAKTYLSEKEAILKVMNSGNSVLFCNCLKTLQNSLNKLAQ